MGAPRVAIIGAGAGGLAAALSLAAAGAEVTLLERAPAVGGKMRTIPTPLGPADAGPTVFTMRAVFDALFDRAGVRLEDRLTLTRTGILARHAWDGSGDRLDLHGDPARSQDAIAAFAGPAEGRAFAAMMDEARAIFETLSAPMLTAQKPGPLGLGLRIGLHRLPALFAIRPFETMARALAGHFRDPRLIQLFGRYATYCGASPFAAPATLMLIAHVEQAGVFYVEGGMHALARAMADEAMAQGARIRTGTHVAAIETRNGRATGVRLAGGEILGADAVVLNADPAALSAGLFGAAAARAIAPVHHAPRSLSAMTWVLAAEASGFPLTRHSVFFSRDYPREFAQLGRGAAPDSPTIYVCAQDRGDDPHGPGGAERLLILMNAPARGDEAASGEAEATWRARSFAMLERAGLRLTYDPAAMTATGPQGFHHLFPGSGGALYGRATHGPFGAFRRPGARTRLPGLYLAGGGCHPGAGVPMAALSGMLAAEALTADLPRCVSIRAFPRPAIAGGISTR